MTAQLARRLGLRGYLILLLLAAFAAIYALIVTQAMGHHAQRLADAGKHLLHSAQIVAARQQAIVDRADAILSDLMLHPALRPDAPGADCSGVLAARLGLEPRYLNIGLVRPDGDVVCRAIEAAQRINLADRPYFQRALKTRELVISDVVVGRTIGKQTITFAKSVWDAEGRVRGVLFISLDLAWMHSVLEKIRLPEGSRLVVVDGTGLVAVRHPDPEGWAGRGAADTAIFRMVAARGEGIGEETGLDGIRRVFGFTPLLDTVSGRMMVWVTMTKEALAAPARQELAISLFAATAALLLVLGLVYWGGDRMLLRPLLALSRAADRFGAGTLSSRSGLPHCDNEIGRLARAFDEMAVASAASAQRFQSVAEASLDALFILRCLRGGDGKILDFVFTDLNARAEAMLGMTREQVVGQKLCELIPINRSGGFFDKYAAVVETGAPLEEEFPIDAPQIGARWLRHQVVRFDDGIAISSRDITAWKEASAEIRRQDRLRTQILQAAGEGVFGLDGEGRATFANPAACAMLQWQEEELVGQTMHALHHHTRADGTPYPREECPIYRAFHDGIAHSADDELFWRKDGTSFPVQFVSTPMRDDEGRLVGAVVSFSDIGERKARERILARAQRALKTLSTGNMELVRATDEQELLEAVCRVIVEQGGYRMAWVAYADDNPEKTVTPRAWYGAEDGYLAQLRLTWADSSERGLGPTSRAIRTGEPQVTHDILSDAGFAPWRELAEKHGYASNFTTPLKANGRITAALGIYAAEPDAFGEEEIRLLSELGDDLAFGILSLRIKAERDRIAWQHAHHAEILQKSLEQSIEAIAYTVEARDPYTAGHERRVGELAVAIARELSLAEEMVHGLRLAASIHDLGKIHVPAEILAKPGRLTDIEFMLIKTHPQAGYDILKNVEFPWPIADIVRQHHEKLDGTGYPQGLKDGEILFESRIMTVADVVEAMASHRPYRPALGIEAALKEIERGRGSAYDAAVVDACLKLFRDGRFAFGA